MGDTHGFNGFGSEDTQPGCKLMAKTPADRQFQAEKIGWDIDGRSIRENDNVVVVKDDYGRENNEFGICLEGSVCTAIERIPGEKRGNSILVFDGEIKVPCLEWNLRVCD